MNKGKRAGVAGFSPIEAERAAIERRARALGINKSDYWRGCLALENALAGEDIIELGLDVPPAFRREHRNAFEFGRHSNAARPSGLSPQAEWAVLAVELIFERAPQTVQLKLIEQLEKWAGQPWFNGAPSPRSPQRKVGNKP